MLPTPNVETIDDYPVFYINTENSTPVDQKEVYIDAKAWLDPLETTGCGAVGSADEPVVVGIRGRGNATWNSEFAKPYKLKFDKKQSFFNKTKNKHWVLLPLASYSEFYNNFVAFQLAKQLGLPFQPDRFPVQLVLNGDFLGIYMLSEHVRIDEGRIDIYEQPDLNEDEATIPYGWLVEVDNYSDPCQIKVPIPGTNDEYMRLTYHTPEDLSDRQHEWLSETYDTITNLSYGNPLDTTWQRYIDIDDFAKYFLAEEIINNMDAFAGSTFLYKDMQPSDSRWHFGPLWDNGWAFDREKTSLIVKKDDKRQLYFTGKLVDFPAFRKRAKQLFDEYMETYGDNWIDEFCDSLSSYIDKGFEVTRQVWPDVPYNGLNNQPGFAKNYFKKNLQFMRSLFDDDWQTHDFITNVEYTNEENPDLTLTPEQIESSLDVRIFIDELDIRNTVVNHLQTIRIKFESDYGREPTSVLMNGTDITELLEDNSLTLQDIDNDVELTVTFGAPTRIPVSSVALNVSQLEMLPGETFVLEAIVLPESAAPTTVKWSSHDPKIVEVDENGNVMAMSPGTTEVFVTVCDRFTETCMVTVNTPGIEYGDDNCEVVERLYASQGETLSLSNYINDVKDAENEYTESGSIRNYAIVSKIDNSVQIDSLGNATFNDYDESVIRAKDVFGRTIAYFDIVCGPKVTVVSGLGIAYTHHVRYNSRPVICLECHEDFDISGVTLNGEKVDFETDSQTNVIIAEKITTDTEINLTLKKTTGVQNIPGESTVRLYVDGRTLYIDGKPAEANVVINDMKGVVVMEGTDNSYTFDTPGVYIVKIPELRSIYKINIAR